MSIAPEKNILMPRYKYLVIMLGYEKIQRGQKIYKDAVLYSKLWDN